MSGGRLGRVLAAVFVAAVLAVVAYFCLVALLVGGID